MAVTPLLIGGMALAMAGSGINYMQQKKAQDKSQGILDASQKRIKKNMEGANQLWQQTAAELTPEEQEKQLQEKAGERDAGYQAATTDAANVADLVPQDEGTPTVVKTEAAKQLGDRLAFAKAQMSAKAKLGGWTDALRANADKIRRSGEGINLFGNFSAGDASAAQLDSAAALKPHGIPIGDILQGIGGAMSSGAGMAGGMGAGAGAAGGAGGLGSLGAPMNTTGSSIMTADPGWFSKAGSWATTPLW